MPDEDNDMWGNKPALRRSPEPPSRYPTIRALWNRIDDATLVPRTLGGGILGFAIGMTLIYIAFFV